ncbi:hypothetical protein [Noviherbaspirillum pedocola]|uniref:Transmembrane protein n=1 Tax=Noviherbaspirillum pedocola TaxID=2801341 RepID=A0A934W8Y0_9BURK|nr:hypothetical protein [Noviherbaspirillum pedocola]MBK4738115.1 hypothetical protein [Noviherbaspirillum pedocola]
MSAQHIAIGVSYGVTSGRGANPDCIKEWFNKVFSSTCSESPMPLPKKQMAANDSMVKMDAIIPKKFREKIEHAHVLTAEPCFFEKIKQGFEKLGNKLARLGGNGVIQSIFPNSSKAHEIYRTVFLGIFVAGTVCRAVYTDITAALPGLIKEGTNHIVGIASAVFSVACSVLFVIHAIRDGVVQFPSLNDVRTSLLTIFKNAPSNVKDLTAKVADGMLKAYEATKKRFQTLNIVNTMRETSFLFGNVSSLIAAFSYLIPGLEWAGIAANVFNFFGNVGDFWQGVVQTKEAILELAAIAIEKIRLSKAKEDSAPLSAAQMPALESRKAELDKKYTEATDKLRSSFARGGKAVWAMLAAFVSTGLLVAKLGFGIGTGIAPAVLAGIGIAAVAGFVATLLYPKVRNLLDSLVSKPVDNAKVKMVDEVVKEFKKNPNNPDNVPSHIKLLFPVNELSELMDLAKINANSEMRARISKAFGIVETKPSGNENKAPDPVLSLANA